MHYGAPHVKSAGRMLIDLDFVPFLWLLSVKQHALNYRDTMLIQTAEEMLLSCLSLCLIQSRIVFVIQSVKAFDPLIDVFLYRYEGTDFASGKCGPRRAAAGHVREKFVFQLCSPESGE